MDHQSMPRAAVQFVQPYPFVGYVCAQWQPQAVVQLPTLLTQAPGSQAQASGKVTAVPNDLPQRCQDVQRATGTAEEDIMGRVWDCARDPQGCWKVQRALETANNDEARTAIAAELAGHVWEAVRCPHANHVVQKCIIMLRPRAAQFILDEIMRGSIVFQAVRHKYGCRVVQRLLEQCHQDQVHGLAEAILSDVYWLSRHPFGNYVMQHLLEFGTGAQRLRIVEAVAGNLRGLARDTHGRSVVNACLLHGPEGSKTALALVISQEPGLLSSMGDTRQGRLAARTVREALGGPEAAADFGRRPRRAQRRAGRASTAPSRCEAEVRVPHAR
mmetsp:Transcript_56003/g.175739  ORF Transcript_56003/g.175739 Transcript_56003/m.175739 type:complete len:329 (+) Transcript_56003:58-1044(+)